MSQFGNQALCHESRMWCSTTPSRETIKRSPTTPIPKVLKYVCKELRDHGIPTKMQFRKTWCWECQNNKILSMRDNRLVDNGYSRPISYILNLITLATLKTKTWQYYRSTIVSSMPYPLQIQQSTKVPDNGPGAQLSFFLEC